MHRKLGVYPGATLRGLVVLATLLVCPVVFAQDPATLTAEVIIPDEEGLVPLIEYVPLIKINLVGGTEETPAPRVLASLVYTIIGDPNASERAYAVIAGCYQTDLLEFAMFRDANPVVEDRGTFDNQDNLLFTWDNTGAPVGQLAAGSTFGNLRYELDFIGTGSCPTPQFPVRSGLDEGETYFIVMRTSATWRSMLGISCRIDDALMVIPDPGCTVPRDVDGELVDSYPEFPVESESAYSSSFATFDPTGSTSYGYIIDRDANAWLWPHNMYTPLAEHSRPRWDMPGELNDFVTGEWLQLRRLFALENWAWVIGINIHSTAPPLSLEHVRWHVDDVPFVFLEEVNLVLTDIGADPYGPPGNGGFNPTEGLETFSAHSHEVGEADVAEGRDFAFNGAWVYHDTNGDGLFTPPVQEFGSGVSFSGQDYPLYPSQVGPSGGQADPLLGAWEYVPLPPYGGDPWWKIKLRFSPSGRRRNDFDDTPEGWLTPVPNNYGPDDDPFDSEWSYDYFVVIRPDSGYQDVSLYPGDGTGLTLGADFRAFIEPRRFNPATGHFDGGIYADSMIPPVGDDVYSPSAVTPPWQDDVRWGLDEPWWPQRTMNANTAKPVRSGIEVHDLVLTYNPNNRFGRITHFHYAGQGSFGDWLDPFGLLSSQFLDGHDPDVHYYGIEAAGGGTVTDDSTVQFPFETVPFFNPFYDSTVVGPRSAFYTNPPPQPTLPEFATWPPTLQPGEYPSITNWLPEFRKARNLKQHIDVSSPTTAMLGFNLIGADDVMVNRVNQLFLQQLTVALWGPDLTKQDFLSLDTAGTSLTSGVALYEDADHDGVFDDFLGADRPVALSNLAWRPSTEPIDLDGDGVADDINGDGVVNATDYAWVLRVRPRDAWLVPISDERIGGGLGGEAKREGEGEKEIPAVQGQDFWSESPKQIDAAQEKAESQLRADLAKALEPGGNPGDDLFLVVRTSSNLKRFEQFRALVPATLPSRPAEDRLAGFQFSPRNFVSPQAFAKLSPEEGIVQDFYGNDLMETNVPVKIVDLTGANQTISQAGPPLAVLGIDMSTNRPDGTVDSGAGGVGGVATFTVATETWTPGAHVGYWLVDGGFESYFITGNTATQLTLQSGTPRSGVWRIVKDPSFLEQVVVELYDTDDDGKFIIQEDLLPLNIDQTKSGVALYRDNDTDPINRNGQFDSDVDIPLTLDDPPVLIGEVGEPDTQIKFVFSSPGTDNLPVPIAQQPRLRQWVPDSFGANTADPFFGPEIFLVVRASTEIQINDDFRVAIVSWGPNTPTEPDPDTFTYPPPPIQPTDEFDIFSEFPWGARAVGFITFFKTPPDNSGYNWIRTTVATRIQTGVITAALPVENPNTVTITSVSRPVLPEQVPVGGFGFSIFGQGFGTSPTVTLAGILLTVNSSVNTQINVTIPGGTTIVPDAQNRVVLTVTNTQTGERASRNDLFTLTTGPVPDPPTILSVSPDRGTRDDFPVAIFGANFGDPQDVEVFFDQTAVPVETSSPTRIDVAFPIGGFPKTGPLDVTVRNKTSLLTTIKENAFDYVNPPAAFRPCFIATAAYGSSFAGRLATFRHFRDAILLKTAAGAAVVDVYYSISPAVAEVVAKHRWVAACVRVALTPIAWLIEHPMLGFLSWAAVLGLACASRQGRLRTALNDLRVRAR